MKIKNLLLIAAVGVILGLHLPTANAAIDPKQYEIKIGQYMGKTLPNAVLKDSTGKTITVDQLKGKPLILNFVFYRCPHTCHFVALGLAEALQEVKKYELGKDFNVLSVGFDEKETLADLKTFHEKIGKELKNKYPKSYDEWHFTLAQADQIKKLTEVTGFKFIWSDAEQTFYHPNVYVVITPKGKISRYLFGLYPIASDIEMAIRDAANEKVSSYSWINSALQSCLKYDHLSGRYRVDISKVAGGIGFFFFVLTGILILVYKKRRG